MGYTGAVFKDFFGTSAGILVTSIVLFLWILIPVWFSLKLGDEFSGVTLGHGSA